MLHANLLTLSSVELELLPTSFALRKLEFLVFAAVSLTFDSVTFVYEIERYPLKMHLQAADQKRTFCVNAFETYCIIYIQTGAAKAITMPHCRW